MFYLTTKITKFAKDNKGKKIFVLLRVLRGEKIIPQNTQNQIRGRGVFVFKAAPWIIRFQIV
jgi:hypothetical protein